MSSAEAVLMNFSRKFKIRGMDCWPWTAYIDEDIRSRYRYGLGRTLAKEFSVSPMTISRAVRGETWSENTNA
jgi:hypothetical protein